MCLNSLKHFMVFHQNQDQNTSCFFRTLPVLSDASSCLGVMAAAKWMWLSTFITCCNSKKSVGFFGCFLEPMTVLVLMTWLGCWRNMSVNFVLLEKLGFCWKEFKFLVYISLQLEFWQIWLFGKTWGYVFNHISDFWNLFVHYIVWLDVWNSFVIPRKSDVLHPFCGKKTQRNKGFFILENSRILGDATCCNYDGWINDQPWFVCWFDQMRNWKIGDKFGLRPNPMSSVSL